MPAGSTGAVLGGARDASMPAGSTGGGAMPATGGARGAVLGGGARPATAAAAEERGGASTRPARLLTAPALAIAIAAGGGAGGAARGKSEPGGMGGGGAGSAAITPAFTLGSVLLEPIMAAAAVALVAWATAITPAFTPLVAWATATAAAASLPPPRGRFGGLPAAAPAEAASDAPAPALACMAVTAAAPAARSPAERLEVAGLFSRVAAASFFASAVASRSSECSATCVWSTRTIICRSTSMAAIAAGASASRPPSPGPASAESCPRELVGSVLASSSGCSESSRSAPACN